MELGLKGKSALVLASSGGLGKAIAMELAREGARVMLFSRSEEQLQAARQEIFQATGNRPEYYVGSMTDPQDVKDLVQATVDRCGPIYALVNNSGGPRPGRFEDFDDMAWQEAYELCLLSYIRVIREALPSMRANGGGRILCSTSSSVKAVLDNLILSNTFRMGVVGLAKTLSQELGHENILVNVIGPGRIGTPRIDQLDQLRAEKQKITVEQLQRQTFGEIPLGRYGQPEEYGRLAAFLCSEANTYLTGQTILLDGGMVKAF
ncbi:MAG: SDR family oxidoreductase [Lawsonibacter sp.]